ncbi:MAG TPA: hypothetical protein VFJ05_02180 [Nitrososphaeraceae archaeon]|nr:hypothetical protein [Nitrososphaeraceae archaeon]
MDKDPINYIAVLEHYNSRISNKIIWSLITHRFDIMGSPVTSPLRSPVLTSITIKEYCIKTLMSLFPDEDTLTTGES